MTAVDAALHSEVLQFYAHQMRLLDALDLPAYAATFTADGVTRHVHRGQELRGREALLAHARQALPRYATVAVRHWNDHYAIAARADGVLDVRYCSLVTLTDAEGRVRIESTFTVVDELVRVGGRLHTRSRTIDRDRPAPPPDS
ncbi:hypothetical protein GCM10010123_28010 [Pilimelia anulata]|uniref:SnoaL-like domain-containing protein n=1 Tax=Pilimelia anulata TaxID=53371 RepID=A0A8J3F9B5_9ACTN|nr:nuclear transport factor 2 family protein [Pilimelia anulata]GGJ96442.1 hypothetical protein GCM10010123_28010 [Pilimelia anulata]